MKFKFPVTAGVYSPQSLMKAEDFLDAVQTYCHFFPEALPEKWGWWEPLNRTFNAEDLSDLVHANGVCETVYWKRRKMPKIEGSFGTRWRSKTPLLHGTHATIRIASELKQIDQMTLVSYLKSASVRSKADFAFIDVLVDTYKDFGVQSGSAPYRDGFLFSTHLLRHWLPDVFWGTVFGPPYVRLLGKDRLLSAPAYLVEELGAETIYVQLTENLTDVVEDGNAIQSFRTAFKQHFRDDVFFVPEKAYDRSERGPVGDVFATPVFELIAD